MLTDSKRRYQRIIAASGSSLLSKGMAMIINFAIVPLTVRYLGAEQYGVWVTITTTVTMFVVMDIGIANTLTNLISKAYAQENDHLAAKYFTTAFWTLTGVMLSVGTVSLLLWHSIPWAKIVHTTDPLVASELPRAFAIVFFLFLATLPLGLGARLLAGYQELHTANIFTTVSSVLSFGFVVAAIRMHAHLPALVGAFSAGPLIGNVCCLLWLWIVHKPWTKPWPSRLEPSQIPVIFRSGGKFFAIQVAGLVVFNTDNLIISHFLSPAQVTPCNVTWRLVGYLPSLLALFTQSLWPAYSEAYARGQISWIRNTYQRVQTAATAILLIGAVLLAFSGRSLIRAWAGNQAVPSTLLLNLMCAWMVIYGISLVQSCLLGATDRIERQAKFAVIGAVANLILSIYLVRILGVSGPVLGSVISYALFIVSVQAAEVRNVLQTQSIPATVEIAAA